MITILGATLRNGDRPGSDFEAGGQRERAGAHDQVVDGHGHQVNPHGVVLVEFLRERRALPKRNRARLDWAGGLSAAAGWPQVAATGKPAQPVRFRAVAIDEDWSALRFRRVEFIKAMTRAKEHRMTTQGKARPK